MTKLLARRPRYEGRHRACATPGCPIVARHRVNVCAQPAEEARCPDPECGELLRLIAIGAVGHCGRDCAPAAELAGTGVPS
jgi:hypothetical protein